MPRLSSRGTGAAYNFGFCGMPVLDPPGTYTMPMGWAGPAYKPSGWTSCKITLKAPGGVNGGPYGKGTTVVANSVPTSSLEVYTPTTASGGRVAQGGGAGSGGSGGSTSGPSPYRGKNGGGATAAVWGGGSGSLIAAGGGGSSAYYQQGRTRGGLYETAPSSGPQYNSGGSRSWQPASGSGNGSNGGNAGCYYGGGGGGGGTNVGGRGGPGQGGGSAGGHLGGPFGSTGGSTGSYDSYTVNDNGSTQGHAHIEWG